MNLTSAELSDLEVLYLSASGCYGEQDTEYEIQRIMQHIAPGSKPLCLTLELTGYYDEEPLEAMKSFFSNCRIAKFCARGGVPPPVELLNSAPDLTDLIFDHCRYDSLYNLNQRRSSIAKLDSWIIRNSSIYIEDLKRLVKQYSAQSMVVSHCRLFSKNGGPGEIAGNELGERGFKLPNNVLIQDLLPDPTADWDKLD
ncbi:hypothetical protein FRC11_005686 [Ceratobasidium sp. 423]|nr:hypothetical protein FRC11_005686 [Ceratobasidium sp. 423]